MTVVRAGRPEATAQEFVTRLPHGRRINPGWRGDSDTSFRSALALELDAARRHRQRSMRNGVAKDRGKDRRYYFNVVASGTRIYVIDARTGYWGELRGLRDVFFFTPSRTRPRSPSTSCRWPRPVSTTTSRHRRTDSRPTPGKPLP